MSSIYEKRVESTIEAFYGRKEQGRLDKCNDIIEALREEGVDELADFLVSTI